MTKDLIYSLASFAPFPQEDIITELCRAVVYLLLVAPSARTT